MYSLVGFVLKQATLGVDAEYTRMALPSLVQLQLHTGGAAGREVEGDPNLLWNIANQYLKSITTVEEACAILSGDSQGANNRPQAVDSDVRAAVRLALIKDGQREALAERVLRADLAQPTGGLTIGEEQMTWTRGLFRVCLAIDRLRSGTQRYHLLPQQLKNSRSVSMAAVRWHGKNLEYVPERLRHDRELVTTAVSRYPEAIKWASEFAYDDAMANLAVASGPMGYYWLPEVMKNRMDLIEEALRHHGEALRFVPHHVKENKRLVIMALNKTKDPRVPSPFVVDTVRYVAPALLGDHDVAKAAIRKNSLWFQYLPDFVRADRDIAMMAVQRNGQVLKWVTGDSRRNRDILLAAVTSRASALPYVPPDLIDKDLALLSVRRAAHMMMYVPEELQKDKDIVAAAAAAPMDLGV